jgi:hypothetical protein
MIYLMSHWTLAPSPPTTEAFNQSTKDVVSEFRGIIINAQFLPKLLTFTTATDSPAHYSGKWQRRDTNQEQELKSSAVGMRP